MYMSLHIGCISIREENTAWKNAGAGGENGGGGGGQDG